MFYHHLKFFIRKVRKDIFSYSIGYLGLIIGLSIFSLLGIYATQEFSHGTYVPDYDKIYRLHFLSPGADKETEFALSHGFLANRLRSDFPQVVSATRLLKTQGESIFRIDNREFKIAEGTAFYADEYFLNVFDLPLLAGDKESALSDPNNIIITESFANRLFGSVNVVGQTITNVWGSDTYPLRVAAVLKDLPKISHFQFDYIMAGGFLGDSWDYLARSNSGNSNYVYFRTIETLDQREFDKVITSAASDIRQKPTPLKSVPLRHIHFYPLALFEHANIGNRAQVILIAVAGVILLFASILNFMVIHISQFVSRTKELGIRQSMGVSSAQLARQFISESILSIFIVGVLTVLAILSLHQSFFQQMIGHHLITNVLMEHLVIFFGLLLIIAATAVVIGLLRMKNMRQTIAFKASSHSKQNQYAIIVQYAFAILTVIGSYFVWKQLDYLQNIDIGYSTNWRINIARPGGIENNSWQQFKMSSASIPGVKAVGGGLYKWIGSDYNSTGIKMASGSEYDSTIQVVYNYIDDKLIPTLGVELSQGRNFNREFAEDTFNIIVNETAARALEASDIIGKRFYSWIFNERSGKIIGVVKDFHYQSMDQKVPPVVLFFHTRNLWAENLVVSVDPANIKNTLNQLSIQWDKAGMTGPFDYTFLDQFQAKLFEREAQSAQFMGVTASCSILVALIGLIGLVSFQNKRRSKELSLRKVFGASVPDLLMMINKTYALLIGISIMLALPIAYLAVSQWLDDYAYRITPTVWDFALVAGAVLLVSLITVSLQSWQTATSNPTDVLRSE